METTWLVLKVNDERVCEVVQIENTYYSRYLSSGSFWDCGENDKLAVRDLQRAFTLYLERNTPPA